VGLDSKKEGPLYQNGPLERNANRISGECAKSNRHHREASHRRPGCRYLHHRYSCDWARNWSAKAPGSCGSVPSTSARAANSCGSAPNCRARAASTNAAVAANRNAAAASSYGCRRCLPGDCRCSSALRNADRCRLSQPTLGDHRAALGPLGHWADRFAVAYWGGWMASAPGNCFVQNPAADGHDPWNCLGRPKSAKTDDWCRSSRRGQIRRWSSG
jgi:hypothetical protein